MSAEPLAKLSVYFGERMRAGDQLLATALLDRCERAGVTASVLLRGVGGFGHKHHLRTDATLTLSEDLPALAIGLGPAPAIAALRDEVAGLMPAGLVITEPIRLLGEGGSGGSEGEEGDGAVRLSCYLGRKSRVGGRPAFVAVCDLLHRRGMAGATALLGVDGGVGAHRQRARFFGRNAEVPVLVSAVTAGLDAVRAELADLVPGALCTVEPTRVCRRDGVARAEPDLASGAWHRLTVYSSETAQFAGAPMHRELLRRLRAAGAVGATSLRGVWGFHGAHAPHGDRLLQLGRRVPTVTTVIDTADRLPTLFEVVSEVTADRGLVTSDPVPPPVRL